MLSVDSSMLVCTVGYTTVVSACSIPRVLDHDTYSAHDAIGKVYIDLNPLLVKDSPSVITGWFPVYDTMHGKLYSTRKFTKLFITQVTIVARHSVLWNDVVPQFVMSVWL